MKTEVLKAAGQGGEELSDPRSHAGLTDNPLPPTRHSSDFRSVHWFGQFYTFTRTQAACVKELWEARENGTPVVANYTILEAAKSEQSRVKDGFKQKGKKQPAWG